MKQVLCKNDCAFHQTLHLKTGFYVFARVTHVYDWMTNRKLEILAYVWIQTHNIAILKRFILLYLVRPPYSASPVLKGLCYTMGYVSNSVSVQLF